MTPRGGQGKAPADTMSDSIEDYALIGDGETAALVSRAGSIDWLCVPRFDSTACFAALLGRPEHGCWRLAPRDAVRAVRRRYRHGTLVLETDFETDAGAVTVVDCMPLRAGPPALIPHRADQQRLQPLASRASGPPPRGWVSDYPEAAMVSAMRRRVSSISSAPA
jgi:GH15 family glucan-1,4-alpha-glucosidase